MLESIDHIGIAVRDVEESKRFYTDLLGMAICSVEQVESRGLTVAFLPVGEANVELVAPATPNSALARFLRERGPGLHHVAYRVKDVEQEAERLRRLGVPLLDPTPRFSSKNRRAVFLHPSVADGVLIQLVEDVGG